ncbi:hypothetical protein [Undibacterium curvum]|uniref:Uncharacterized protein n=1 Tax=Undibacterium curvum TaxID=2762294 RepID=A0ABR7A6Z1_9BURK|nr:hypothetical protein [Undibacterium curvum]MBC3932589.1 hypothetical protein [Undibacterium curvum]
MDTSQIDKQRITRIRTAILHYVTTHADACDSTEGIYSWWIDWQGEVESMLLTRQALEQLEAEGVMQRLKAGGRDLWRLSRNDTRG